jgi:pimeloyl-ACP methyl ester carboxylesterase
MKEVMSKTFSLDQTQVVVTWQEILPAEGTVSDEFILFLPGWPLKEPVKTLHRVGEQFAKSSHLRTYIIYTKNQQIVPNSSYPEAQAICQFLAEAQLSRITLVGFSQGSIKAMNIIALLQEMKLGIRVEGLILINSAGLTEVSEWKFVIRQLVDLTLKTWLSILRESLSRPSLREKFATFKANAVLNVHGTRDFLGAVWKEARPSLRGFVIRLKEEIRETTSKNPYLDRIEVPTVLVQGTRDHSFDMQYLRTQPETQPAHGILQKDSNRRMSLSARGGKGQIFAVDLFPHSPYVRVVSAHKFGTHLLPIFRSQGVARASFYLLQRFRRRAKAPTQ